MTTPKQESGQNAPGMSAEQAYEIVKDYAHRHCVDKFDRTAFEVAQLNEAIAVLSRLHAHFSRFKVGDEVWLNIGTDEQLEIVNHIVECAEFWYCTKGEQSSVGGIPDEELHPTREEAQAESEAD